MYAHDFAKQRLASVIPCLREQIAAMQAVQEICRTWQGKTLTKRIANDLAKHTNGQEWFLDNNDPYARNLKYYSHLADKPITIYSFDRDKKIDANKLHNDLQDEIEGKAKQVERMQDELCHAAEIIERVMAHIECANELLGSLTFAAKQAYDVYRVYYK